MSRTPEKTHRRSAIALVMAAALLAACASDGPLAGTPPTPLPPSPFLVSNPQGAPLAAAGTRVQRSPQAGSTVAWVSLPPGSLPSANAVTIHDPRTGAQAVALVTDGGFDPVAVSAGVGDTLDFTVQGAAAGEPSSYRVLVPATSAPHVVRTTPPPHKRDVALNCVIVVTFSEPMDSASAASAIKLRAGSSDVPGTTVVPAAGAFLFASFTPAAALEPLTDYVLEISASARDRDGDTLTSPVQGDFTSEADSARTPADTTAPPSGADVTPPVATILEPAAGDTQPVNFPHFTFRVTEDRSLARLDVSLVDPQSEEISGWAGESGDLQPLVDRDLYFRGVHVPYQVPGGQLVGTMAVELVAVDAAGNVGHSAPRTYVFVEPDTTPRIVIQSFTVVELGDSTSTTWLYAPQLAVADQPGGSGFDIVGFEILSIPGLPAPFPSAVAKSLSVPAGSSATQLFHEVYGDYPMEFFYPNRRSSGGMALARVTYRDGAGHYFATTVQGPIVAGTRPGTYTAGCGHWIPPGISSSESYTCPSPVRQAVQ